MLEARPVTEFGLRIAPEALAVVYEVSELLSEDDSVARCVVPSIGGEYDLESLSGVDINDVHAAVTQLDARVAPKLDAKLRGEAEDQQASMGLVAMFASGFGLEP